MEIADYSHTKRMAGTLMLLVAVILAGWLSADGSVAVIAILVLLPLGFLAPRYVAFGLIGVLAIAPFAAVTVGTGGYNIPVICAFAPMALIAAGTSWYGPKPALPVHQAFPRKLLFAGTLLLVTGTISFALTRGVNGTPDTTEYLKWISLASLFVVPPALGSAWTMQALRLFAVAAAVGAAFAIASDVAPQLDRVLSVLGYIGSGNNTRYFVVEGVNESVRAAGSYTDPNIAGLVFVLGLAASFSEPRRAIRYAARVLLLVGLVLTLSREAYVGVVIATVALVVAPSVTTGRRAVVAALLAVGIIILMLNPATHNRLAGTFSSQDIGSQDRLGALSTFRTTMNGHWEDGFGFGRPEFRESAAAYKTNVVADAPLASIYRGGIIEGIGFVIWYFYVLGAGLCRLRDQSVVTRAIAAGSVAFCAIALAGYGPALIPQEVALLAFWAGCTAIFGRRIQAVRSLDLGFVEDGSYVTSTRTIDATTIAT
jgi:hypothetical protein